MSNKIALVVEENQALAESMQGALLDMGYIVEVASGEASLKRKIMKIGEPTVLVTNFGSWGGDLFDAAMQAAIGWTETKVVILTTNGNADPFDRVDIEGHEVLVMPFDLETFNAVVG